jgi:hypothetical protein
MTSEEDFAGHPAVQAGLQLAAEGETLSCADCSAVIVYRHGRWTR